MTISSSLNAGVAGLQANATRLASISDNIANSSTYGYKRVETDFASMVLSGNGGSYAAGGVRSSTTRQVDQRGTLVATSNATDLAVRGAGMLPVATIADVTVNGDDAQMFLSTTGSFRTDAKGYLKSDTGLVLMGWPAAADGTIPNYARDTSAALVPVKINTNALESNPTTSISLGLNLPAVETQVGAAGTQESLSVEYFDNLGTSQSINLTFTPTVPASGASNEWTIHIYDESDPVTPIGEYVMTFTDSRSAGGLLASVTTVTGGAYDPVEGKLIVNVPAGPIEIDVGAIGDSEGMTQLSYSFAPVAISKDGSPVGNLTNVDVDPNGYVRAYFDTGEIRTIYKVPLVHMPNMNGLIANDSQTYTVTKDSGDFFLWDAGDGPTGDIVSFAREESATDVAGELTSMIKTQRAYSSNAKVIQTVDEMLQETTNIKR
ncbi:flagellar hook-basal body complex protein [Sulfitobacter sp. LCG007]